MGKTDKRDKAQAATGLKNREGTLLHVAINPFHSSYPFISRHGPLTFHIPAILFVSPTAAESVGSDNIPGDFVWKRLIQRETTSRKHGTNRQCSKVLNQLVMHILLQKNECKSASYTRMHSQ